MGIATCKDIDQLLTDSSVEALVIATPDRTHFHLASAALRAGRDVLVEKPMALEPQEAEALAGQAQAGELVLAVGHTAVHNPEFAALLAAVRSDPDGSMRRATAVRSSSGFADGRTNPILDLCPHDLAMAVLLFGTPVAARARCDGDSVEYEVRFENDALLNGRAEWCQPPYVRRFEVTSQWGKGKVEVTEGKGKVESGNGQVRTSEFPLSTSPLGRQCLDFIECCRTRRQPLSDGWLGVAVTRCLAALSASSAGANAWVPLPSEPQTSSAERRTADSGLRASECGVRT
jgi:predicted dehydrogenase